MTFSTGFKGVEVSSVSWLGQFTVGIEITDYFDCGVSKIILLLNECNRRTKDTIYKLLPTSVV